MADSLSSALQLPVERGKVGARELRLHSTSRLVGEDLVIPGDEGRNEGARHPDDPEKVGVQLRLDVGQRGRQDRGAVRSPGRSHPRSAFREPGQLTA